MMRQSFGKRLYGGVVAGALLVVLMVSPLLLSCSEKGGSKGGGLFGATGKPLEMVVVVPDSLDSDALRDSVNVAFGRPMEVLPQAEPLLSVMIVRESGFSQMFKSLRNILYLTVDGGRYTGPSVGLSRDQYANGQLLLHARAESLGSLYRLLHLKGGEMSNLIYQEELVRLAHSFDQTYSSEVAKLVQQQLGGWHIRVSTDLDYTHEGDHFVWASDQGVKGRTDFLAYSYPYEGAKSLELEQIIAARDSVLKQNVVGAYEGSFMSTEHRVPQVVRRVEANGIARTEVRGLWAMVGDMMGGPFVLHAIHDEVNGCVLVVEMVVYNPGGPKKNLMLLAESQLYTLEAKEK